MARPKRSAGAFTAIFERHGRWVVAFVEEIPGVNTQGKTMAEARRNLREALRLVLEANRQLASSGRRVRRVRESLTLDR